VVSCGPESGQTKSSCGRDDESSGFATDRQFHDQKSNYHLQEKHSDPSMELEIFCEQHIL
jgi:hypothetical protein